MQLEILSEVFLQEPNLTISNVFGNNILVWSLVSLSSAKQDSLVTSD